MMPSARHRLAFRNRFDASESIRRIFGPPMVRSLLLILCLFFSGELLRAQQPDGGGASAPDSGSVSKSDSLAALAALDTLLPYNPQGTPLGSFRSRYEAQDDLSDLTKTDFPPTLYFSSYELLEKKLPAFPLSQGMPGLRRAFSYAGSDPRGTAVLFNGRPLRGAGGGAFDLELFPPEFIERVEVARGAEAALYGDAGALLALNVVEPRFNVAGSYLRLAYAQGPGNTSNADITFARNINARTNLTVGFRHLVSDGIYVNQNVSLWNVRGSLTWRPTNAMTLSLTELFGTGKRGAGGGLTPTSLIDPELASVENDTLDEGQSRHDLTLAAQWYPGLSDSLALDSGAIDGRFRVDGAAYYSHAERSLQVGDDLAELTGFPVTVRDDVLGFRVGGRLPLPGVILHGNAVAELTDGQAGRLHAGGMGELPLGDNLRLFAGGAATRDPDITVFSLFGEGRLRLSDSLDLRFTARTFFDDGSSATGASGTFSGERSRLLLEGEGRWQRGGSRVTLGGYMRSVASDGAAAGDYSIIGADASIRLPIAFLVIEENALLSIPPSDDKRFPQILSRSDFYVPLSLFNNNLDLRLGATLEYQTAFAGSEYDVLTDEWLYPADASRRSQTGLALVDVYARARIGSAYIKLTFGNVLDAEYWSVYRYPVAGRSLRLGINWALID